MVSLKNVNALFHEDYDPYKDSIVFSQIGAQDFTFGRSLGDWLMKLAGPYGAPLKGADYVWKDIAKYYTTKNEDKKQDVLDDLTEKSILQALGHAGLVPFFKDINKLYKKFKYEEKKKTKRRKNLGETMAGMTILGQKLTNPSTTTGKIDYYGKEIHRVDSNSRYYVHRGN